jgi:hypothetical protein
LDNTRLPFAEVPVGGTYLLRLEPFNAQPQLATENLSDTVIDDFTLPVYYDAGGTSLGFEVTPEAAPTAAPAPALAPAAANAADVIFPAAQSREVTRAARLSDIASTKAQLAAQVTQLRGYPAWQASLRAWRSDLEKLLKRTSFINIARAPNDLSTRSGLRYLLDDSLQDIPAGGDGAFNVVVAYHQLLQSNGIDLVFVPIPPRDEVYADILSSACPPHRCVSPQLTKFLQALCDAGVEVVDLRDAFLDERQKRNDALYTTTDIHWSSYGIRRAVEEVAPRIRRYFTEGNRIGYSEKQIRVVEKINRAAAANIKDTDLPPGEWDVFQVLQPDGTPYRDVETSPVAIAGDSYTLRYVEQSGSVSAHLAKAIGFPVCTNAKNGGAPQALQSLLDHDAEQHVQRRVIVWLVSAAMLSDERADLWKMPHSAH